MVPVSTYVAVIGFLAALIVARIVLWKIGAYGISRRRHKDLQSSIKDWAKGIK
jgi:hypothetical protein